MSCYIEGGGGSSTTAKYFLHLLNDIYHSVDTEIGKMLLECLIKFDKDTSDKAKIKYAHEGKESDFKNNILKRNWNGRQKEVIAGAVGLLITTQEIIEFDPGKDKFIILDFNKTIEKGVNETRIQFTKILSTLAKAIKDDVDIFLALEEYSRKKDIGRFLEAFEAKPGVFGLSIDIKQCAKLFLGALHG